MAKAVKSGGKKAKRELSARQSKFIALYQGNGTEAARQAGYTGSPAALGKTAHDLLRNPKIKAAIEAREHKQTGPLIATREERQAFWSLVMNDRSEDMKQRLRASELLGKSQADFTDKVEVTGKLTLEELIDGSRKEEKS